MYIAGILPCVSGSTVVVLFNGTLTDPGPCIRANIHSTAFYGATKLTKAVYVPAAALAAGSGSDSPRLPSELPPDSTLSPIPIQVGPEIVPFLGPSWRTLHQGRIVMVKLPLVASKDVSTA